MLNCDLIETYAKMSDSEKMATMRRIIRFGDMSPLNLLFAIMLVLEPEKIEELCIRLRTVPPE